MNRAARFAARTVAAIAFLLAAVGPAAAQTGVYTKPVRFIIPYPAGGPTDLTGRVYAEKIAKLIGQPVVVENKPGAQGVVAMQLMLQAPADGSTMYFGTLSTQVVFPAISAYRKQTLPFDIRRDLVPVSLLGTTPLVVVASERTAIASVKDLVDTLKAQPGQLNYGSDGIGALSHLGGELINQAAGTQSVHIPYKGTAEFSQALISGDVQYGVMGNVGAVALMRQNRVRALAVAGSRRSAALPGVPTTAELGYPSVDLASWFGVFMKAGTPRPLVDAMAQAIISASHDPEVVQRLTTAGIDMGVSNTPEQFAAQMDADVRRWTAAIGKAALKFEN